MRTYNNIIDCIVIDTFEQALPFSFSGYGTATVKNDVHSKQLRPLRPPYDGPKNSKCTH